MQTKFVLLEQVTLTFFTDDRVQAITHTFAKARTAGLIQHYADDTALTGRTIRLNGRDYLNFVTCSYLGLEFDPRIVRAIGAGAERYGASFIVSRTYVSSPSFAQLEAQLAKIFGAYPVVAPSTTLGHLSFMSVMIQPGDVLILDQQVHNSVQLAASTVQHKAKIVILRHNDMDRLERLVEKYSRSPETNHVWYCGDGIYSMFGDVSPVSQLVSLLERHDRFYCYLDDAHGMSTQGEHGRGYVLSHQQQLHPKMVVAVSLSKCFGIGCGGALVFPCLEWQQMVYSCGATMIFSSPIPPPMLSAGIASASIHLSPEITALQGELADRVRLFREIAAKRSVSTTASEHSPIQYIMVGDFDTAITVVRSVMADGFFLNICAFPAVAINHAGLRLTINRHLRPSDIRDVVDAIARALDMVRTSTLGRT